MESRLATELAMIKMEVQEIKHQNQVWKDMMTLLLENALASQGSPSMHPLHMKELSNSLLQHPGQKDLPELKEAIEQWEKGDPSHGLFVPLCDWDADMRKLSECQSTYSRHKLIVKEFDNFGRDEDRMRQVYGNVMDGTAASLVKAIYKRHRLE
ncbi:hypothetical protein BGZ81_010024 [Podila clonocystis]|nr:hypothetical protein BGZ81_010024 [Podila clonocystis]